MDLLIGDNEKQDWHIIPKNWSAIDVQNSTIMVRQNLFENIVLSENGTKTQFK